MVRTHPVRVIFGDLIYWRGTREASLAEHAARLGWTGCACARVRTWLTCTWTSQRRVSSTIERWLNTDRCFCASLHPSIEGCGCTRPPANKQMIQVEWNPQAKYAGREQTYRYFTARSESYMAASSKLHANKAALNAVMINACQTCARTWRALMHDHKCAALLVCLPAIG